MWRNLENVSILIIGKVFNFRVRYWRIVCVLRKCWYIIGLYRENLGERIGLFLGYILLIVGYF